MAIAAELNDNSDGKDGKEQSIDLKLYVGYGEVELALRGQCYLVAVSSPLSSVTPHLYEQRDTNLLRNATNQLRIARQKGQKLKKCSSDVYRGNRQVYIPSHLPAATLDAEWPMSSSGRLHLFLAPAINSLETSLHSTVVSGKWPPACDQ